MFFNCLLNVVIVKNISAFRTEFRRMCGVFRLPSALVALVKRCAFRFLLAAVAAEFTLIYLTAGAGPAGFRRLGTSAFYTEFSSVVSLAAGTGPA